MPPESTTDTIAAAATAHGESALAIVRLSGPRCPQIARDAFHLTAIPESRRALVGVWRTTDGEALDQCVFVLYNGTASYTGEPMLEVNCHGNPFIVQRLLRDCLARDCRMARPGEFTRRAFLNGRLDLTQAEAVADTIGARSEKALAIARRNLAGGLGKQVAAWTERLLQTLACVEAYIDFPEEELPPENAAGPLAELSALREEFTRAADTARFADTLRDGVRVVIAGAPNAGKSSLLNALLGEERTLVSDEPGTTRDFVHGQVVIAGHNLCIIDTAGLRDANSPAVSTLEKRSMERSREQIEHADFCLLLVDGAEPLPDLPDNLPLLSAPGRTLLVLNKSDLPANPHTAAAFPELPRVALSAKTGDGIAEFKRRLGELLEQGGIVPSDEATIVNARHAEVLRRCAGHLAKALASLRETAPAELAASDIRLSIEFLGEIVGRVDNERMLDKLFATFCIGK